MPPVDTKMHAGGEFWHEEKQEPRSDLLATNILVPFLLSQVRVG